MPCCSVQICGNRSSEANFRTCGVTYHIFPKANPSLKEKWIEACGRKADWFPTQHAVICSSHFEEKSYQPYTKTRRLIPDSVPTLKLRLVFETPTINSKHRIRIKKTIIKPGQKMSTLKRYKVQIEKYKKMLHHHRQHIRRLQKMVNRYRNKADGIKNVLTALKNENAISEEHLWLLESDGGTFLLSAK